MSDPIDVSRNRNDGVVIPRIWVAFALSVLLHIAALWELPPISVKLPGAGIGADSPTPLTLRLIPPGPPIAPPSSSAPSQPAPEPAPRTPKPKAAPRPPPAPPVIALKQPKPDAKAPVQAPSVPVQPSVDGDMAALIEARRRARGDASPAPPAAAAEDDNARRNRIIAGNLGTERDRTFGYDPSRGGGVFQIERINLDYAEFIFHGWNKDVRRNTKQLIEVRKGNSSDIRLAVVRRMIAIIREYEQEDFLWVSQRLGRNLTLSARARDNAGLEEFMMREFFSDSSLPRR